MSVSKRVAGALVDRVLGLPTAVTPYIVERNVHVPMPDGVVLLGDRYRPEAQSGALPVVLVRLPYGRRGAPGLTFAAPLARRGFQVFIQSTRGTFGSGGQFRPFTTEKEDGLATVEWLRGQPWCDGRVAMTGGSYFGHTQWAIAPYVDPPLTAISPSVTAAHITGAFYDHGVPQLENALSFAAGVDAQERGGLPPPLRPIRRARLRKALRQLPLQAVDVTAAGGPVPFWRDFVGHAGPGDDFWSVADHHGADLRRMPPTLMVTGWWDLFLSGQLADYVALRDAGVAARLVIGPWRHGEPGLVKEVVKLDVEWLDHHLRDAPAPQGPAVRLLLQQTDTWLGFETWPPPGSRPVDQYLRHDGRLSGDAESTTTPSSSAFTYDPDDPTPTAGGPTLQPPGKQADNRPIERRPDVQIFTGGPLQTHLDLVGPVSARIYVRPELEHADVFVRLCDVAPDGVSRNIVDGIRRIDPRTMSADDVTVGDDGVLAVDVQLFPTAYRVHADHRLRVQISGGAFPRYARNLGTGLPFGTAVTGRPCRFEVFHDRAHPSRLVLSVLDGGPQP